MRLRRVLLALVVALCSSAPAFADESARVLYDRGIAHYRVGDYAAAIEEFKAAYELHPSPQLLFNLAQAYRQLGNRSHALYFYRAFVQQAADSPARADAESMVASLEAQERAARERAVKRERPDPVPVPAATTAARPTLSRGAAIALVTTTAVGGVALLAGGAALSARADDASDALTTPGMGARWRAEELARYEDGQASSRGATALYVIGASTVAASVISAIVLRKSLAKSQERPLARGLAWAF